MTFPSAYSGVRVTQLVTRFNRLGLGATLACLLATVADPAVAAPGAAPAIASPLVTLPLDAAGAGVAAVPQLALDTTRATVSQGKSIYRLPPGTGTPNTSGGTGTRGGCQFKRNLPPLASLVGQEHLMRTVSDRPTIWIYVPYTPAEAPSGILSIQLDETEVYRGEFLLTNTPGIVGINLPEDAPQLAVGQEYDWFINVNCTPTAQGTDTKVTPATLDGFIQLVAEPPQLTDDLAIATTPLDRAMTYGAHSVWYDLFTTLARLQLNEPMASETAEVWADLLADEATVGLAGYVDVPLAGETTAVDVTASSQPK